MADLFTECRLEVLVPDERVQLDTLDTDNPHWWSELRSRPERKLAFFDERLFTILCIKFPNQPSALGSILQRLQISLEASYISPFIPSGRKSPNFLANSQNSRPRTAAGVPIIPPATPNPIPTTNTPDRPYAQSDPSVVLQTYTWGENRTRSRSVADSLPKPPDAFTIAWSQEENSWIALYELHVLVTFLQTRVAEPLLCLTVSATLRDKTSHSKSVQALVVSGLELRKIPVQSDNETVDLPTDEVEDMIHGIEEVNLLGGLNNGTTFGQSSERIALTTARVGESVRQSAFMLPPPDLNNPNHDESSEIFSSLASRPVLRKSYRKTLRTLEGIRVRMKNCFVPYVPESSGDSDHAVNMEESAAGSEERTVILSVEIENNSNSASAGEPGLGFIVDNVKVDISGGHGPAHASLIEWERKDDNSSVFPLVLRSVDQYNLLYRVTFSPPSDSANGNPADELMRRYVAINITGHPFRPAPLGSEGRKDVHLETFSSKWNCLLDLATTQQADPLTFYNRPASPLMNGRDVLPAPPSPFPSSNHLGNAAVSDPWRSSTRASARGSALPSSRPSQLLSPPVATPTTAKFTPSPPSAVIAAMNAQTLSFGTPSPTLNPRSAFLSAPPQGSEPSGNNPRFSLAPAPFPQTPAFPAYPSDSGNPNAPNFSQAPLVRGFVGDSAGAGAELHGENIGNMLITVSLVPPHTSSSSQTDGADEATTGDPRLEAAGIASIYPHDTFSLDIFVVNMTSDIKRCEIAYPMSKRRRRRQSLFTEGGGEDDDGLMPLDNRIRVGPLLPGASQSVRMQMLALKPGVHMIDTLTLTDVATSFSVNLRSVMSVVVINPVLAAEFETISL